MDTYSWDAGVALGYVVWSDDSNKKIIEAIDKLSPNCYRFVHNKAVNCRNFMSTNSHSEIKNRLEKNYATYQALVQLIKTNKFSPNHLVDISRLISFKSKFSSFDSIEVIENLIRIQSTIQSRFVQLGKLCKFERYSKRIEKKYETLLEEKFDKRGDLLNFSASIHIHNNECECCFITTDKNDFGSLDFSDINLPYKFPNIEFVQDY